MDNLNVLVEAKKEYLGQMCLIMIPPMIEVFQDMYIEAMKTSKGEAGSHHVSETFKGGSKLV